MTKMIRDKLDLNEDAENVLINHPRISLNLRIQYEKEGNLSQALFKSYVIFRP